MLKKLSVATVLALTFGSNVLAAPKVEIKLSSRDSRHSCGADFKGVLQPENNDKGKLRLSFHTSGFSGRVRYKVVYSQNGYKDLSLEKSVTINTRRPKIKIPVHPIADNLPYAINSVMVTARSGGQKAVSHFTYKTFRSLILEKDSDSEKDCFKMFKSEVITGIYSNTSSQPRRVDISDRMERSYNVNNTRVLGWSFNISPFNLGSLGFNNTYIKSVSKGVSTSSGFSVTTTMEPGESMIFFRQMTLMRDAYKVKSVDQCGRVADAGEAFHSHFVTSYPSAMVNTDLGNPLEKLDLGYDDTVNTCNEDIDGDGDIDIFIPDENEPTEIRANVGAEESNRMNSDLANEGESVNERKSRFLNWWKRTFRRSR